MTEIISHYIWPSSIVRGLQFPKTSVLSVESHKGVLCCQNEVTFGKHLRSGAGCQENQQHDQRIGTLSPTFWSFNQLSVASDLVRRVCVRKPP